MLQVDVPTAPELRALAAARADACVSLFVETTPQTQEIAASRIQFANLAKDALKQLDEAGFDKRRRAAIADALHGLGEDDAFWRLQARTLAVLATPDALRTFRLATRVAAKVEVADRFHLKPLLRALAFDQHAFVLALSEGEVRLVEIFADAAPARVRIADLPKNAADSVGRASLNNLGQNRRIANAEGQTTLLQAYARHVDRALRPALAGGDTPLILASTAPLGPIFRKVCSCPGLLPDEIALSPDHLSEVALAEAARPLLDRHYAREVNAARALFMSREPQGRASGDIATIARAATVGALEQALVDMECDVAGTVADADGAVTFAERPGPGSYDVLDEIAARTIVHGGRVLAVRRADIPGGGAIAATFRYTF
jgi:hypothetical protein